MFLSIVIPIYNAQSYIDECLQSCLCQDIDKNDYQIICVDDGSTDNSLNILNDYQKAYSNIVVVSQNNSGVSVARNKGLSLAQGDYIWFVDSDDFIRPNCLGELKMLAQKSYDIIAFGRYEFDLKLNEEERNLLSDNKLKPNKTYWGYAALKIYKRSIIEDNKILFHSEIKYGEDEVFNNDVFEYSDTTYTLECTNYLYRKNPSSAMNTLLIPENQIKRIESIIISMVVLKQGIESRKYTKEFSRKFLTERYKLLQNCFKRINMRLARKYFRLMKEQGLFSFNSKEIKNLGLPSEFRLKTTYLRQRFKICSKSFYKKTRTKIKNMLPKSIVRIIKKLFKLPED